MKLCSDSILNNILSEIEEYYYKSTYNMAYYDTSILNKALESKSECTITTILLKYDKSKSPDSFLQILKTKLMLDVTYIKDLDGQEFGNKNPNQNRRNKSKGIMKKSVTFSIHYYEQEYKIKIFNKGSILLNGVKSTDSVFLSTLVKHIKEYILEDYNLNDYNIIMSNYKIHYYFVENVNRTKYRPIPKMKEIYDIFTKNQNVKQLFSSIFSEFNYKYDSTSIEFCYLRPDFLPSKREHSSSKLRIKYSCYSNILIQGNIYFPSTCSYYDYVHNEYDNLNKYIQSFANCDISDINFISNIMQFLNLNHDIFLGCIPVNLQ